MELVQSPRGQAGASAVKRVSSEARLQVVAQPGHSPANLHSYLMPICLQSWDNSSPYSLGSCVFKATNIKHLVHRMCSVAPGYYCSREYCENSCPVKNMLELAPNS